MAKYNIGGFIFTDEESARMAAKELKAVDYILSQLSNCEAGDVLKVYNKLLDEKTFQTKVGVGFLDQLHKNLIDSGEFDEKLVRPVYSIEKPPVEVKHSPEEKSEAESVSTDAGDNLKKEKTSRNLIKEKTGKKPKKEKISKSKAKVADNPSAELVKLKKINTFLKAICIGLVLCIIGMFYVNSTINSPTILNYEEEIVNKYSAWEQELTEREAAVRERELEK